MTSQGMTAPLVAATPLIVPAVTWALLKGVWPRVPALVMFSVAPGVRFTAPNETSPEEPTLAGKLKLMTLLPARRFAVFETIDAGEPAVGVSWSVPPWKLSGAAGLMRTGSP